MSDFTSFVEQDRYIRLDLAEMLLNPAALEEFFKPSDRKHVFTFADRESNEMIGRVRILLSEDGSEALLQMFPLNPAYTADFDDLLLEALPLAIGYFQDNLGSVSRVFTFMNSHWVKVIAGYKEFGFKLLDPDDWYADPNGVRYPSLQLNL